MNAPTFPALAGESLSLGQSADDLLTGHAAAKLHGLVGNVVTFLRQNGHLIPAQHEAGRNPLYRRGDLARCRAGIDDGTIVLTGSALSYFRAEHSQPETTPAPAPALAPLAPTRPVVPAIKTSIFPDPIEEIANALRPLADLAGHPRFRNLPADFALVGVGDVVLLTMNDAREASVALNKISKGRP